ncbi:Sulfide:quinone oxidoreductase-like protein [Emericellopsis cladophorae]|uniref:Sulfide:quinone oxidoreductase-like protein n=1 Tax=Emericellopsis cladophorae TaxID=2686198 RepID=A0A9P9Y6P9_9HYPO|nr:Sulfide:quinone oxidoreductase-like protein [Emericellopsis cladophorae]KAI6784050.1 Sulfide:quinone oxidoreductase-like protein [Emericellopsis cladophorae]
MFPTRLASVAARRSFATVAPASSSSAHKVVVVGAGTAGLSIAHQLLGTGRFKDQDIAVVDPAEWHHYQPGWTLVGGGLKTKEELRRRMTDLVDPKFKFYNTSVGSFKPEDNAVRLGSGQSLQYEHLLVAPGVKVDFGSVSGLPEALADAATPVSSIYGYESVDKLWRDISKTSKGRAIFTQPAGAIKCAGAPQKVMWLALDHWRQAGLYKTDGPSDVDITFASGLGGMFAVPKYAAKLEQLRKERGVEGLFFHDLVSINGDKAVFARPDGQDKVERPFDLLHVVPKMGPHAFVKDSPIANEAGYVDVHDNSAQHKKYANIWSSGDASSLPTSKTAAAVTAQAPVIVNNILNTMDGKPVENGYDGYTSCPLLTEYGKVLLAEFKYGGVPKETFGDVFGIDQAEPRRSFYHLKKDFFPWVYYNNMVKGTWGGPKGWLN